MPIDPAHCGFVPTGAWNGAHGASIRSTFRDDIARLREHEAPLR
jgi:hypothetical protein